MENKVETEEMIKELENEMQEINDKFNEFLHTKGLVAKFKLAFSHMHESAVKQREQDRLTFEEIKRQSAEDNKDFVEFLHTKGLKAKIKLVIENIKRGAREANEKTKHDIARAKQLGKPQIYESVITLEDLNKEFNEFLKQKGLDSKFTVTIVEK